MTGATVDAALLSDIKDYLDISWDDPATDRKVTNFIQQGMFFVNDKLGAAGDFLSDGYPRTLLFEYVRYARDKALDVFEANYKSMILAMQNGRKVAAYVASSAVSTGE